MNERKNASYRRSYGITGKNDRFEARLWLDDAREVAVELIGGRRYALERDPSGLWVGTLEGRTGDRYRLVVDGAYTPDPYARRLPDGAFSPAELVDLARIAPVEAPVSRPLHEVVILEVHVGTATPQGTFRSLIEELPRYRDLGITALEFLPLNQFGGEFGWGYDGVFFFAPHHAYGAPADLAALIDAAHRLGLMVFNDVVYNHLGPVANPWPAAAASFMREDASTRWGPTLDFREPHVRAIVIDNVLEWLECYRFDGLRFDAVHTLVDDTDRHILEDIAAAIRAGPGANREIHLILENDDNELSRLVRTETGALTYDSQWNDDLHHALHVATTGEGSGHYYRDFADRPIEQVGRCLTRGFAYYGEFSQHRGRRRGEPYALASPFAFCNFAQNHDQVGNRGLGDRLNVSHGADAHWLCATIAWLAPGLPMLWMGEESGTKRPFPFFGDYPESLAPLVRAGRKRDHEGLPGFDRADAPDPVARKTFLSAKLPGGVEDNAHAKRVRALLSARRDQLAPRFRDAEELRGEYSVDARVLRVRWALSGAILHLAANFGAESALAAPPPGVVVACTHEWEIVCAGTLPGRSATYTLEDTP